MANHERFIEDWKRRLVIGGDPRLRPQIGDPMTGTDPRYRATAGQGQPTPTPLPAPATPLPATGRATRGAARGPRPADPQYATSAGHTLWAKKAGLMATRGHHDGSVKKAAREEKSSCAGVGEK